MLMNDFVSFAKPEKVLATKGESASKAKTLSDFSKLNFGVTIPQDILKSEEELKIQQRMIAEIKKLREENSGLDEKVKQLENIIVLNENLHQEKDRKINNLELLLVKADKLDSNNQEIIKNLRTENTVLKAKTDFLQTELEKANKSKNKRAKIIGIIAFILGIGLGIKARF